MATPICIGSFATLPMAPALALNSSASLRMRSAVTAFANECCRYCCGINDLESKYQRLHMGFPRGSRHQLNLQLAAGAAFAHPLPFSSLLTSRSHHARLGSASPSNTILGRPPWDSPGLSAASPGFSRPLRVWVSFEFFFFFGRKFLGAKCLVISHVSSYVKNRFFERCRRRRVTPLEPLFPFSCVFSVCFAALCSFCFGCSGAHFFGFLWRHIYRYF